MIGKFGKKVGNIGENVVGKAAEKVGDVTEKVGDIGETVIDKTSESQLAELFKEQSDVLLTKDYFDKYQFNAKAKYYSPYNAYSLALASYLAYSVTGEDGKDVSGKLELNKQALKNFLRNNNQQEQQTEVIFAKLENWLSNFKECNFITGKEKHLLKGI